MAGRIYERKIETLRCSGYFVYEVKICQNLDQRKKVKIYMCSGTLNGKMFLKNMQWHRPIRSINGQF